MNKNANLATNIIWNTVGSIFYFACQWLLSVLVVRLSDDFTNAGILSLAMSVSGIFYVISLFNVRNYQVSDTDNDYASEDYVSHRIITSILSFLICVIFVIINGYNIITSLSIASFMLIKIVEAFADVLHGEAQKEWRLDIAGKSCIIRGILLIIVFSSVLITSKNLPLSIFLMSLTSIVPLLLYDYRAIKKQIGLKLHFNKSKILSLTKLCIPMVLYGICTNAIIPLSKYFLEFFHGEEVLGYYATVSSVAVLVQALVALIFTPLVGVFNMAYRNNNTKGMLLLLAKLVLLLTAVTLLAILLVFLIGAPIMSIIFGKEILPYTYLLYPTIISSSLTALVGLMGMILVIMRSFYTLLGGAIAGTASCLVLCLISIPSSKYAGANLATIVSLALISIIYFAKFIIFAISKKTKKINAEVSDVNT